MKFCTRVGLLSVQIFSPFGELWLAGSQGSGGITSQMNVAIKYYSDDQYAFFETNIEASGKARWAVGIGGGGVTKGLSLIQI